MLGKASAILLLAVVSLLTGCTPNTCLAGDTACNNVGACRSINGTFSCDAPQLAAGDVAELGIDLADAEGVPGDLLLTNGVITAVIAAVDPTGETNSGRGLAPGGGVLIDLGPSGGDDDLNYITQLAGVLPEDTFRYTDLRLVDRSPDFVAVIARGQLDGRDEVEVVTRYELRPCEPGLRIRSELHNGTADVLTLIVADLAHWGKRDALPFAARIGEGFESPELDLVDLQDVYVSHDYVLARPTNPGATTYGFVACGGGQLSGVNDPEISALGTPVELVRSGETVVLERFVSATGGEDLGAGLAAINRARETGELAITAQLRVDGEPAAASFRAATLLIGASEAGGFRPLVTATTADDGRFAAAIEPTEVVAWELWSFGRPVAGGSATPSAGAVDLGDIDIEPPAQLTVAVHAGGTPIPAEVIATPADQATAAAVRGSWFGRLGDCAPWLGPPVGGSPACNRILTGESGAAVEIPAGRYRLIATAGPSRTVSDRLIDLAPGAQADVSFTLLDLDVVPDGWISSDLHVHGKGSFDSSIPDLDRVLSFAAHDVQVIVATDHDYIVNYASAIETLGLEDRVAVIPGLETTPLIPFLDVPGEDIPQVIGHFNHWPLAVRPELPRAGAPFDELIEPGALFDLLDPTVSLDAGIHMLNHPWDETQFGRDLGYLRAINFDPRVPIPAFDDGSSNGMLMRAAPGGKRNVDFDLVELQNGGTLIQVLKTRPLWFSLLSQGFARVAAASSDSHSLSDAQLGYGRTHVKPVRDFSRFDPIGFNVALKAGHAVGGNGPFIVAEIGTGAGNRRLSGLEPYVLVGGDTLEIEVRAAPWIPVTEVRLITSRGVQILGSGDDLTHPASPLDSGPLVRFRTSLAVDQIVAGRDDWIVIEAGLPLFDAADLDDDGVPDTTDNNGDGVIDAADIEDPDDDSGPLRSPPDPIDFRDPRYTMTRVVPGAWTYAFTNAFFIDADGDGWEAPGL
jgi:hypothetical protein